jgi:SOS response regulatory protein OraA/RecX
MTLKPLEVLKKGLKLLQKQVKTRKDKLQAQLAEKKTISPQDEEWLDQDANLVNEQKLLDDLEKASDYERGLDRLDKGQKTIVRRL